MIKRYTKRPVTIEAVQWTGDNIKEIKNFCKNCLTYVHDSPFIVIHTLEGDHFASPGDYIIKGVAGEYYPCKPDIFEKTYKEFPTVKEEYIPEPINMKVLEKTNSAGEKYREFVYENNETISLDTCEKHSVQVREKERDEK